MALGIRSAAIAVAALACAETGCSWPRAPIATCRLVMGYCWPGANARRDVMAIEPRLAMPTRRGRATANPGAATGATAQRPRDDAGRGSLRQHADARYAIGRPATQSFWCGRS